jgi:hypothetical protein
MVTVLQEDGGIKPSTLPKLKKLDSFMRESRRLDTLCFCGYFHVIVVFAADEFPQLHFNGGLQSQ